MQFQLQIYQLNNHKILRNIITRVMYYSDDRNNYECYINTKQEQRNCGYKQYRQQYADKNIKHDTLAVGSRLDKYVKTFKYFDKQNKENRQQKVPKYADATKTSLSFHVEQMKELSELRQNNRSQEHRSSGRPFGDSIIKRSYLKNLPDLNNIRNSDNHCLKKFSSKKYYYQHQPISSEYGYETKKNKHRVITEPDSQYMSELRRNRYTNECHENDTNYQILQSRKQIDKQKDIKISNIEKINEKIKQILQTLNQEQKKITHNHQNYKILDPKKRKWHYQNRNKTEGDYEVSNHKYNIGSQYQEPVPYKYQCVEKNSIGLKESLNQFTQISSSSNGFEDGQVYKTKNQKVQGKNSKYQKFNHIKHKYADKSRVAPQQHYDTKNLQNSDCYQFNAHQGSHNNNLVEMHGRKISFENLEADNFDSFNIRTVNPVKRKPQNLHEEPIYNNKNAYDPIKSSGLNFQYSIKDSSAESNFNGKEHMKNFSPKNKNRQTNFQHVKKSSLCSDSQEKQKYVYLNTPNKSKFIRQGISSSNPAFKKSKQKDYDNQILKIQQRIESFDQIKKDLGIYDESQQLSRLNIKQKMNSSKISHSRSKSTMITSEGRKQSLKKQQQTNNVYTQHQSNLNTATGRFPSKDNQQSKFLNKYSESQKQVPELDVFTDVSIPKPFKLQSKRINNKNSMEASKISSGQQSTDKQRAKSDYKNKCTRIITQNHTSQSKSDGFNSAIKQLIKNLCAQIQFDQKLRDLKKWFMKKNSTYKWYQIKKYINSSISEMKNNNISGKVIQFFESISENQQMLRSAFYLSQEQDNPFYTQRDQDGGSYRALVEAYFEAQHFWCQKLHRKYPYASLEQLETQIDIDRKGSITVQDVVRFINIQSDEYYRNRDIFLIFKRFSTGKKTMNNKLGSYHEDKLTLQINDIMDQLCQNSCYRN